MSDIAAQLAELKDMYAKGVLSLEQGGEKVTFTSGAEMRLRISDLEMQLASQSGSAPASRFHYPTFSKGL